MPIETSDRTDERIIGGRMSFRRRPARVQVQSVLYNNEFASVQRAAASLARAAELAVFEGVCSSVTLKYGDGSTVSCITEDELAALSEAYRGTLTIEYMPFNANLGSARGHNRLAEAADADFFLIQNPDVVVFPRLLEMLLAPFDRPGVGMTEAKQLPIEHPKEYDVTTGETSWATTACAMIPAPLFRELDGFDADSFFLYCDDVDFSWRVRLAGYLVLFQPAAAVFHDKRLSTAGRWQASSAEHYYSAEAALFMAHKWSRHDLLEEHLSFFVKQGDDNQKKAAAKFEERRKAGTLPEPVDADHKIGQFIDNMYARHRFAL
jgi:hypothetical protein